MHENPSTQPKSSFGADGINPSLHLLAGLVLSAWACIREETEGGGNHVWPQPLPS